MWNDEFELLDAFQQNKQAWNNGAYDAWFHRFGPPAAAAEKLKAAPSKRIGKMAEVLGDVRHKKIINLMGSNGNKAVSLALMGAEVTVVDYSSDNARYAKQLADEAGVRLTYIISDVLQLPAEVLTREYDFVFLEFGILHYFVDLMPLCKIISRLLRKGGLLYLQDFHPVSTKLISSKGTTAAIRKHKVTGDYFATSLEEKEISFSKYLANEALPSGNKVRLRFWTLGEILTAVASEGLFIRKLEELPNQSSDVFDKGIPKTFILVAEKLS